MFHQAKDLSATSTTEVVNTSEENFSCDLQQEKVQLELSAPVAQQVNHPVNGFLRILGFNALITILWFLSLLDQSKQLFRCWNQPGVSLSRWFRWTSFKCPKETRATINSKYDTWKDY